MKAYEPLRFRFFQDSFQISFAMENTSDFESVRGRYTIMYE